MVERWVIEMSHTLTNIRNAGGHWETINCFAFHSLLKSHFTLLNILHHNLLSFYGSQIVNSYIFTRNVQFLIQKSVGYASEIHFWSRVFESGPKEDIQTVLKCTRIAIWYEITLFRFEIDGNLPNCNSGPFSKSSYAHFWSRFEVWSWTKNVCGANLTRDNFTTLFWPKNWTL